MNDHDLPRWHSTFSANADVLASTVHARGELDLLTADLLRGTIDVLLRAGRRDIVLDVAELTSIDRAGVKLLAALQHTLSTHTGRLTIINASPRINAALTDQPPLRPLLSSADR